MSGAIYGGDDVGALVIEVGSHSSKAGYAGEETPSVVVPSDVGYFEGEPGSKKNYFVGTNKLCVPRPNMEITNPIHNGEIVDFDAYEGILDNIFDNFLNTSPKEHPIMVGDEAWSSRAQREKITEIMFEKYEVPAYYLMRRAVLSAFASGKSTALVFDIGYSGTSAVPVYDGYVLNKGIKRSKLGGQTLLELSKDALRDEGVEVVPKYEVLRKGEYNEQKMKRDKYIPSRLKMTESYREYCLRKEIIDFYQCCGQVLDTTLDERAITHIPTVSYEFSSGVAPNFGPCRFRIPEVLFSSPGAQMDISDPNYSLTAPQLIVNSIHGCDVDVRQSLYNSILVTGGVSLMSGFVERLNTSLYSQQADAKIKVTYSATPYERQYSAWIGGSILASCGAFQQKWISKQEYQDSGKTLVEKKCA